MSRGVLPGGMRARRRWKSVLKFVFICNVQRCSLLHQGAIEWHLRVDPIWGGGGERHLSVVICRAGAGVINFGRRINVRLSSSR